jgi:thiosulfate/3-mercaptopyruvate sulfurtransferase
LFPNITWNTILFMRAFSLCVLLALTVALAADLPVVQPKELADRVAKSPQPAVFQVGPNVLYRSKHIPGAAYAGPGSRPEGLDLLKSAVEKLPHDREIVIYCGCCPWDKCPNVKPAMELLKSMGFTHVKAMQLPTSFKADWIDQGYPVEQGEAVK